MISKMPKLAAAAAFVALASAQANAEGAPADTTCIAHDYSHATTLPWFLGLYPADDLMAAWCRIQQLPGNVRFNIWFPHTQAHKSWDTTFTTQLPAGRIVELVQSLIPQQDGPVLDENGMPFSRVLGNAVQAAAEKTPGPNVEKLGFAANHPAANELILWEPIVLRVRPVVLEGQDFTLTVTLRPNIGAFALAMQGQATDIQFVGYRKRLPGGNIVSDCSDQIPLCEHLTDAQQVLIHAPWVVTRVNLEANGVNMTESAINIYNSLQARFGDSSGSNISRTTGKGNMTLKDGPSQMVFKAEGGEGGTSKISITWQEAGRRDTVKSYFDAHAKEYRALRQTDIPQKSGNPDASGLLFGR